MYLQCNFPRSDADPETELMGFLKSELINELFLAMISN